MTTGENMKDTDTIFRALRPGALDELADDAHARRRDTDLARAMSAAAEPRSRPRRVALLVAGVAAAACAAAGVAVVTGGDETTPGGTTTVRGPADARTFLLASAKTAERAPAEAGRYWYTRLQTRRLTDTKVGVFRGDRPGKRKDRLSFTFQLTTGQESWTARDPDDRTRTITGIDVRTSFPTKKDEAAWKRAGSEPLVAPEQRKHSVNDYDIPISYTIGNVQMSMAKLRKLPVDAAELEAELRRRHKADVGESGEKYAGSFAEYVFATAHDLLAGPITPGTKAALYRVLAGQDGVRSEGEATDPLGRPGVAVSMSGTDYFDGDYRIKMIIDPGTAELLAYRSGGLSMAYQEMGWVNELGARP
ncbi:CU044_5270 family protein [Actinomadura sp. 3N407]|uniref:CU044_5270 family protein n=1 Tax=Actinomadura sp. 3N407 TaxID=3457423 RepID=UPI003FCCA72F